MCKFDAVAGSGEQDEQDTRRSPGSGSSFKRVLEALGADRLAAMEHDYLVLARPICEICSKFEISRYRFNQIRNNFGWPIAKMRRRKRAQKKARQQVVRPAPDDDGRAGRRLAMINRLYAALERELAEFENRPLVLAREPDLAASGTEGERSARTLTSLIRSFEKISQFDDKARTELESKQPDSSDETDETSDACSLRNEIARRLESLLEDREGAEFPDGAERRTAPQS